MAMNPGLLIPFAVIATAKKSRRGRLTEAMLPAMVPLPPTQAVAMTAIVADQQVRTEERRIERARGEEAAKTQALLVDTVKACKLLVGKPKNDKLTAADLDALPALKAHLAKVPQQFRDEIAG